MYEGEVGVATACFMRAVGLYLSPGASTIASDAKRNGKNWEDAIHDDPTKHKKDELEAENLQFRSLLHVSNGLSDQVCY